MGRGLEVEARPRKGAKQDWCLPAPPVPLSGHVYRVFEVIESSRSGHLLEEPQFPQLATQGLSDF